MISPLDGLGITNPVLAAPMAGGPTTPAMVAAAASVGSLGFIPAGYKTTEAFAEQIAAVRASTDRIGVNLFAPNPIPIAPDAYRDYACALRPEADRLGVDLSMIAPLEDDDQWAAKIDLLVREPVPVVSFTFGVPDARSIAALKRVGSVLVQTVTSPAEAQAAQTAGADALVVQASAAGGHSGTLTPQALPADVPLADLIRGVEAQTALPIIAAGGVSTPEAAVAAIHAGATAVMVGTALVRATESGASAPHKAAYTDVRFAETVLTRAFTGRPARALRNNFTTQYTERAPSGYPAIHHLTSPLRRAAAAAGDAQTLHLWAGTGWRRATAEPTATILTSLASVL